MFSSGRCEETVKTVNSNRENVQSAHDCRAKKMESLCKRTNENVLTFTEKWYIIYHTEPDL